MKYLLSGFLLLVASWAQAVSLNKIVIFGDSLSDNGNLYEYMKHQLPTSPPYFAGRFSNGPVWIEQLATFYYGDQADAHLLDYACGGAGVIEEELDDADEDDVLFTLSREVDSYLLAHHDKANAESLYVLWIGANNYIALPDDTEQSLIMVNDGIQKQLERLAEKGAKHIMVLTLPDLGCTPAAADFDSNELLTDLAKKHNAVLSQRIDLLKNQYPDIQWILFDVSEIFLNAYQHPELYGFSNVKDTCYEAAMVEPSSMTVLKMAASIKVNHAAACDGYLFFDIIHPTTLAHEFIAKEAQKVLTREGIELN